MTGDKELLEYLDENITMGLEALETLEKKLEGTDNKISSNVSKGLVTFKDYKKKCKNLCDKAEIVPRKTNLISIIMAKMGTNTEFMRDNSDSKLADTLIQGYTMGITDITKKLSKYKGDISKDVLELTEDYKKTLEHSIKELKGFL